MPYSFPAFEHLADVGRAPSPAAAAPAGLLPSRQLYSPRGQRGRGAPRRPGGLPHKRDFDSARRRKLYGIRLKPAPQWLQVPDAELWSRRFRPHGEWPIPLQAEACSTVDSVPSGIHETPRPDRSGSARTLRWPSESRACLRRRSACPRTCTRRWADSAACA